jgi:hypothetical protein
MAKRAILPILAAAIIASSLPAVLAAGATKPKAWIDRPLPGQILPLGPTVVTVHAASDLGIAKVRILVEGIPAAELTAPTGDLVTFDWTWQPPGPGSQLLTIVAEATGGSPSEPVSVAVTFVDGDEPAATATPASPRPADSPVPTASPEPSANATPKPNPSPKPTPRPTPKPKPTPTPCTPTAPRLLVPFDGTRLDEAQPLFEWAIDSAGCAWTRFRIQVSHDRTFGTIDQQATLPADLTNWQADPGLEACTTYSWRVRARGSGGAWGPWSTAWTFDIRGRTCP